MDKEKLNNCYVYGHLRTDKDEIFYIGVGSSKNYGRAFLKKGRNKFWQNVVKKTTYKVIILKDNLTWEEACKEEVRQIKIYGRRNIKTGCLVNLTDGGEGTVGKIMSNKEKAFHCNTLSTHRKRTAEINRQLRLGKKLPKETLVKLQGRKLSNKSKNKIRKATSKPVIRYDNNGKFIKQYKSMTSAANQLKTSVTVISNNILGLSKKTKYGIWKLKT